MTHVKRPVFFSSYSKVVLRIFIFPIQVSFSYKVMRFLFLVYFLVIEEIIAFPINMDDETAVQPAPPLLFPLTLIKGGIVYNPQSIDNIV